MAEHALQGVGAAPGVVAGKAIVLGRFDSDDLIAPSERTEHLERARASLEAEIKSLEHIARELQKRGWNEDAEIVETGVLMARDPGLVARVEALVVDGHSAPAALTAAAEESADLLARLDDPTLAQRADDVRSLGRRAAAHAVGAKLAAGSVLIATNLGPADVADLSLSATGAALAEGGVTAHAAIVARSLGVPMVVGVGPELLDIENGEEVVVDGDQGLVIRRPDPSRVDAAHEKGIRRQRAREEARSRRDEPAVTADGHRVTVLVNAATMAEAIEGFEQGAEGIGLLRTELPFLDARAWPSLERQTEFLKPILDRLVARTATVRLFDFGGDKTPPFVGSGDTRGIRLMLESPEALRTQLSAILAAGAGKDLRILVPMVTHASHLDAVGQVLHEVLDGRPRPLLGAMIETPEAATDASAIAQTADFLSLGTNDLTQLVLGLDRERSKTAPVLDVRVLRLIAASIRAAHDARIPIDVCGEAASDPGAMVVLVGLGVDELSVAASRVGLVRQWIRELDFATARKEAEELLRQAGDVPSQRV